MEQSERWRIDVEVEAGKRDEVIASLNGKLGVGQIQKVGSFNLEVQFYGTPTNRISVVDFLNNMQVVIKVVPNQYTS